ncbi:glycoside hydrolase family 89 protein [Hygrophoropsis aurantiaca]|uniref:Glycoside hydrolase family 89 protein n=1 Tax=Hygrophoropsis aurantiaca TaxID=72124 RepID=A0ACB8AHL4_9AGAM|nr:glycoside hydrolase family 89 protein [Hygrophoropsis aurantiaca]
MLLSWQLPVLLCASLVYATTSNPQLDGIYSLVKRRMPAHADSFTFTLAPVNGSSFDSFTLSDGNDGGIHVDCGSVSGCARGLYTYVTEIGGVDIWWTGSRLDQLPANLPAVGDPITRSAIVPYRYMFNTVTFSYTLAFSTFEDWELLIDWMALRGVNLPLAWVGFEYTLSEVFREVGLTEDDISDFFSGPAFQAWNRFGNIQHYWGGPLPTQWINDQFALQKQIVPRLVELGMTPVLPSFTGFVPPAMHALYPNASIVNGSQWAFFPALYTNDSFLEPFDPLFSTMQTSFIKKQQAAFGNVSHIYTLDQYNENNPYSGDTTYLANITSATFSSLRAADPEAIWLMQGWLFWEMESFWTADRVQAYLGGVPSNDSMIILDLWSEYQPQWERLDSYYGKQWVWCELHDYGGTMGMEGNFDNVTASPLNALAAPGSSMVGMGLTPEGLEGNEIIYDVLLDQAWSPTVINKTAYASAWAARRYYVPDLPSEAISAWDILASTVYDNQNPLVPSSPKSLVELTPALGLVSTGIETIEPTMLFYDTNTTLVPALRMLLQARNQSPALINVPEYQHDLVDFTRQILANNFVGLYNTLISAYQSLDATSQDVSAAGLPMMDLIADMDSILLTNENFLLARWIGAARNLANGNTTYANYLEYNARNQITLWGPQGQISDYASKQWGGLVGTYYTSRWEAFIDYLVQSKQSGTAYNATFVAEKMLEIGLQWDSETWSGSWGVSGDSYGIAEKLLEKWS